MHRDEPLMSYKSFVRKRGWRKAETHPTPPASNAQIKLEGIAADEDRLPPRPAQWLAMMIVAAIVGALTGLVGGAFRLTLAKLDVVRSDMIQWSHHHGPLWLAWLVPTVLCSAGAGPARFLAQRLAPQTAGSGIPRIESVLHNHLKPATAWLLPVKFIGGSLSIGSGL